MNSGLQYSIKGAKNSLRLVFLHGFLASSVDWQPIIEVLSERFQCIAVDLPGHGKSLEADYNLDAIHECILGFQPIHGLVGYSMGGRLALQLVLNKNLLCTKLVLESVSPGLRTQAERDQRRVDEKKWHQLLKHESLENFLGQWYRQPVFSHLIGDDVALKNAMAARLQNHPASLSKALQAFSLATQPSLWHLLPNLQIPTLLVSGTKDAKFEMMHRSMNKVMPQVENVAIDAGHNVHRENATAFVSTLTSFL